MKLFNHQLYSNKKALLTTLFILGVSLTGCGGGSSFSSLSKQGLWEQTGYGDEYFLI